MKKARPADLLFDTTGGEPLARSAGGAAHIVTIAAEAPGAQYFVVEPDGAQLRALPELQPQIDTSLSAGPVRSGFRSHRRARQEREGCAVAES